MNPENVSPIHRTITKLALAVLVPGLVAGVLVAGWLYYRVASSQTGGNVETTLRRLNEPVNVAGRPISPTYWLLVLVPVLLVGLFFVVWMYVRDSRSVRWYWAVPLALIRSTVYLLLAGVFLLPAEQFFESAEKRSKVLILLDFSDSITKVSDDMPTEGRSGKLPTRLDKLVAFLTDEQVNFIKRLTEKNPVVVYRMGARLDEEAQVFNVKDGGWTSEEWLAWSRFDLKPYLLQGLSEDGQRRLRESDPFKADQPGTREWATEWIGAQVENTIPPGLSDADKEKLLENRGKLDKRVEVCRQLLSGTNVPDSLLALINRESNNMAQGVVVFSDGRSNLGSESAIAEVRARARKENIPVFTVALGEERSPVSILITELSAPEQTPPDDKFKVMVDVDGVNLAGEEVKVTLDIYKPGDPDTAPPTHSMDSTIKFQPGEPPHAQAEFVIDPELLPEALLKPDSMKTGKKELVEGRWKFMARVPKDRREAFAGKEHTYREKVPVQVIKKPMRILLVASGPNRDYQFLRTMFFREEGKTVELSIYLQNEGGTTGEAVQDVDANRLLSKFPDKLRIEPDPKEEPKDKYYNLAMYDLIIAFDPDWNALDAPQLKMLQTWVDKQAGGLVVVAGPAYTNELARAEAGSKLQPLLEILPVRPGDDVIRAGAAAGTRRSTKQAFRLNFPEASVESEFLKLDDEKAGPLAGWEEFFTGKEKRDQEAAPQVERGFYNFYPLQGVKPGALVLANFGDPEAKDAAGKLPPFLVSMKYGMGRTIFLGSSEMWRLRRYDPLYYERFWTKLGRYASSGSRTKQSHRGVLVMGRQFSAGNYVRIEAQLFKSNLEPLDQQAKPELAIFPPGSDPNKPSDAKQYTLEAKPGQGEWNGWFQLRFPVTVVGEYLVRLPVPDSSDVLRGRFQVEASNPELDNTRPDLAALYAMAGDLDEVKGADTKTMADLRSRLRTLRAPVAASAKPADAKAEGLKLCFTDLHSADIIPDCMQFQSKTSRNRGAVKDLWDRSATVGQVPDWLGRLIPGLAGKPVSFPIVLGIVVLLLSVEWLTRKLLRLA